MKFPIWISSIFSFISLCTYLYLGHIATFCTEILLIVFVIRLQKYEISIMLSYSGHTVICSDLSSGSNIFLLWRSPVFSVCVSLFSVQNDYVMVERECVYAITYTWAWNVFFMLSMCCTTFMPNCWPRHMFAGGWEHSILWGGGSGSLAALPKPILVWFSSGKVLL